ncbi:hypothetical protein PV797_10050 [Clostridiaceae bacterium M8S5]|nr:hypothetical protein PV797_10050 [Clostridiaceae bacterium M8S5]
MNLWIFGIIILKFNIKIRPIKKEEYALGSKITFACAGLSRGSDGKEAEQLAKWDASPTSKILVM